MVFKSSENSLFGGVGCVCVSFNKDSMTYTFRFLVRVLSLSFDHGSHCFVRQRDHLHYSGSMHCLDHLNAFVVFFIESTHRYIP